MMKKLQYCTNPEKTRVSRFKGGEAERFNFSKEEWGRHLVQECVFISVFMYTVRRKRTL